MAQFDLCKNLVAPVQIASTLGDIGTVGTGKRWVIKDINLYNSNTTTETVKIYRLPTGDSATAKNIIFQADVLSLETINIQCFFVLAAGDKIQAITTTASKVGVTIDGIEESTT